jgi:TolA-binding protein
LIALLALPLGMSLLEGSASAAPSATAEYARQVSTAQVRLAQLEALLVESELRIEQLEEVIREQGKASADRLENLDEVNAEVVRLRGAIEVLQFEAAEVKRAVSDQQIASERRQLHAEMRLAQIEKFLSLKPPPPPTNQDLGLSSSGTPSPKPPGPGSPAPGSPGSPGTPGTSGSNEAPPDMPDTPAGKLEQAASQMSAGRQAVARAILKAAIEAHPNAAEMDEIRYRYAETFFNEGDWRAAISEFNKVINNHPNSPWKCWAFFRQGEAFERMGQLEGAKAFYKGATEGTCKSSDAAKEAKKKL